MATELQGLVAFATFEREGTYMHTDPKTGTTRPLRSIKVLLAHGDGTVSRESISLPDNYTLPALQAGRVYGVPIVASVSRKSGKLFYALRTDMKPFPAPSIE